MDDLFIEFISVIRKLKPKVFIAENVKGMLHGSAKGYVSEILNKVDEAGYKVQLFCLNSAIMGVPQRREREFFIGHRKELPYSKLNIDFNKRPIRFGEIRSLAGGPVTKETYQLLKHKTPTDRNLADINDRLFNRQSRFNAVVVWDSIVSPTITSNGNFLRAIDDSKFSDMDFINCQSFPVDYDFNKTSVQYVCGMSVPPLMMKEIARQMYLQRILLHLLWQLRMVIVIGEFISVAATYVAGLGDMIRHEMVAMIAHWILVIVVYAVSIGAIGLLFLLGRKYIKFLKNKQADEISVFVGLMTLAIVVFSSDFIKSILSINLIGLMIVVFVGYTVIRGVIQTENTMAKKKILKYVGIVVGCIGGVVAIGHFIRVIGLIAIPIGGMWAYSVR